LQGNFQHLQIGGKPPPTLGRRQLTALWADQQWVAQQRQQFYDQI
tara:strand:- start:3577 stop:3711 length:135 start_codon:yes stop_codon:yes gene_type:complete